MGPSQDPSPLHSTLAIIRNFADQKQDPSARGLGSKSGLSGLDFMYSGLPIGTAVGHFWPAFDCVGQTGRGLLFRVASNVFPPFPQSVTKGADSATTN